MRVVITVAIIVVVALAIWFLPVFPYHKENVPEDAMLFRSEVGTIAGLYTKVKVTEQGEVYRLNHSDDFIKVGELSENELLDLKNYIKNRDYKVKRISLSEKRIEGKCAADCGYFYTAIRKNSRVISVEYDDFISNLVEKFAD